MVINPDQIIFLQIGRFYINATILFSWVVIALLVAGSILVTRNLTVSGKLTRRQNFLEVLVDGIRNQIREAGGQDPVRYISFVGTLFIFIAVANLLAVVPGYTPPTSSLSTTTALALAVFFAVPIFGISGHGISNYLKQYLQPTPFMLPFNIIGEFSRTLALAVRLYGNIMSGTVIVAILLSIMPLFFPVVLQLFGLLTGLIQAYIFSILAIIYITSASRARQETEQKGDR